VLRCRSSTRTLSFEKLSLALLGALGRLPGFAALGMALVIYLGVGLALPITAGMPTDWIIVLNILGVTWAFVVLCGWFIDAILTAHRRNLLEWTTELRLLDAEEFEWLVGEVFRRQGWGVKETGQHDGPDGNVDLALSRKSETRLVQCKRWQSWSVGVDEIRMFLGTLMREHLPAEAGIYVTLSTFTAQARVEAKQAGLELVDNRELMRRVEAVRRIEPCPICGSAMLFDRSTRGWWFRCVTNGCPGKLDVGDEPGRAIDFLAQRPTS
jgi:restriction system protein